MQPVRIEHPTSGDASRNHRNTRERRKEWAIVTVHWSGFSDEDHTWEPKGQLDNARDVIIDFHRANPSAPWKLRMFYIDFLGLFIPYENDTVIRDKDAPFDRLEVDP